MSMKTGAVVQFRWEPGTCGVVQRVRGGKTAVVITARGIRTVPVDAIRPVRANHAARCRRSIERG